MQSSQSATFSQWYIQSGLILCSVNEDGNVLAILKSQTDYSQFIFTLGEIHTNVLQEPSVRRYD
jgi:hypothetical protein